MKFIRSVGDLLTYFPMWYICLSGMALLLIFFGVWHFRFNDHTYRHQWLLKNNPSKQERVVTFNEQELGYSEVIGEIEAPFPDGTGANTRKKVQAGDLERPVYKIQIVEEVREYKTGAEAQDVKLTHPNGEVSDFTYLLLYNQYSWANGSAMELENFGNQESSPLEVALKEDFVKETVNKKPVVFCIGLASSEPMPDDSPITNTDLSDMRATNLCVALSKLRFIVIDPKRGGTAIALGLGQRKPTESDEELYRRERAAIILAIKEPRLLPQEQSVLVEAIYKIMDYRNIALGEYQREDGAEYSTIMISRQKYAIDRPLETSPLPDLYRIVRSIPSKQ